MNRILRLAGYSSTSEYVRALEKDPLAVAERILDRVRKSQNPEAIAWAIENGTPLPALPITVNT